MFWQVLRVVLARCKLPQPGLCFTGPFIKFPTWFSCFFRLQQASLQTWGPPISWSFLSHISHNFYFPSFPFSFWKISRQENSHKQGYQVFLQKCHYLLMIAFGHQVHLNLSLAKQESVMLWFWGLCFCPATSKVHLLCFVPQNTAPPLPKENTSRTLSPQ